jgi:trk system potassium uptake protein TrkH
VPRFDAACLTLAAISTGGTMPHDGTFSAYGSTAAALVVTAAMLAGALSFFLVKGVLTRRPVPRIAAVECATVAVVIALATLLVAGFAAGRTELPLSDLLTGGLFSVTSLVTTTGLVHDETFSLAVPLPAVIVFVMVGGMYGSTAGGLKVGRVLLMLRDGAGELERLVHPSAVTAYAERRGKAESSRVVWTYFVAYLTVFAVISGIAAASGVDFEHALLWAAAMLGNAGPALGYLPAAEVDPLRLIAAGGGDLLLLASAATMVLGRIEVLALLAILTPLFWKR